MALLRPIGSRPNNNNTYAGGILVPPPPAAAATTASSTAALSIQSERSRGAFSSRHIADINAIIEGKRKVASAAGSVGAVAVSGTAAVTSSLSAPPPPRAQGGAVATRSGPLSTIEAAGREAAIEDGVIAPPGASLEGLHVSAQDSRGSYGGDASASNLRRGKWTIEEEAYAMRLIAEFREGMLPLTDGTTLRTFLAKILNCDPMRISKKFVGKKCIGKVSVISVCYIHL